MEDRRAPVQTDRHTWRRPFCVLGLGLGLVLAAGPESSYARQAGVAQPGLNLLNELVFTVRNRFFVYRDSDSGENSGFPSGWFPGGPVLSKFHLDTACVYDAASPNGCTLDPTRMDRVRGTVLRVTWDPLVFGEFVGANIEEPEHYGVTPRGVGYDLRGATRVCFDAASPTPPAANFRVQFAVALRETPFVSIPAQWTSMCFELASLGLTTADLADVHYLFTVVSNDVNAAGGGTLLLDNIRFEPVPLSRQTVNSFPLANGVFGTPPAANIQPGRVKIPPDQVLANLSTIYESAMVMLTLFATGNAGDANSARRIADAFVEALDRDNQGLPIPTAPDGSAALHNGNFGAGPLGLHNDQGPGGGRRGQVKLAGFSITSDLCGPSHFCLVLDGATGGNNAFVILALAEAYKRFGDQRYLDAAKTIGGWIHGVLLDARGTGFGGYYLGYPDEGQPKVLLTGKSIENNADIFRAFTLLADIARSLGATAEADEWTRRARIAGDFVMAMFDATAGRFYAGTLPLGIAPSPGLQPDGPQRGPEVVNTADFLDAQTFVLLPLASSPLYRHAIDWRRPVQWILDHYAQTVTAGGQEYRGFNLVASSTEGPQGIAWEFTGQAVVSFRFVDQLYGETRFETAAQFYLNEIRRGQVSSPFGDGRGVVAATMQNGDLLPPYEQCLSTPFQCIAARVGLAATTWSILADLNVNPFIGPTTPAPGPVTMTVNKTALRFGLVTNGLSVLAKTPAQIIRLRQGGAGAVSWSASVSDPWLSVTPANGTGPADLVIDVAASSGLQRGTTSAAQVTLTFSGVSNNPGPIAVSLAVLDGSASLNPIGLVDTPLDHSTGVTGAVPVTGWAVDDVGVSDVHICRAAVAGEVPVSIPECGGAHQVYVGKGVFIEGMRPDVQAAYPTLPLNDLGGWGFMLLTNVLPGQGNGTFQFFIYAQDREGHSALLGTRTLTCSNATATKPFGAIDTPTQGGVASGAAFVNFGWALTPQPKGIPIDGSTMTVLVDGLAHGTVDYNHERPDIEAMFPGFHNTAGTHGAIGFRVIDTTQLANGLHTISWIVVDDQGAAEGIGSRFFTVSNNTGSATAAMEVVASRRATASASEIAVAPHDRAPVLGRRGWNLEGPWRQYAVGREGRAVIRGEEVDRFELSLGTESNAHYTGYLRVSGALRALPVGSLLDAATGRFAWAPGVGFVGAYDLVFVRWAGTRAVSRHEVRIVLAPKGSGLLGPQLVIDTPRSQQDVGQPFVLGGWAADLSATAGMGIGTLHVWAYPLAGGPPVFLGAMAYGGERPDVAAVHGEQFRKSGFGLAVQGLAHGHYDLAVFAWSTDRADFVPAKVVRVTVR